MRNNTLSRTLEKINHVVLLSKKSFIQAKDRKPYPHQEKISPVCFLCSQYYTISNAFKLVKKSAKPSVAIQLSNH